ncbi:MAG: hypothetical protein AAFR84_08115 [Pseudomonadota bacterium]
MQQLVAYERLTLRVNEPTAGNLKAGARQVGGVRRRSSITIERGRSGW